LFFLLLYRLLKTLADYNQPDDYDDIRDCPLKQDISFEYNCFARFSATISQDFSARKQGESCFRIGQESANKELNSRGVGFEVACILTGTYNAAANKWQQINQA
jgi:hypothetical protein